MKTNANQNTSTIYYRPLKQWIEVTPGTETDWERFVGTTRKTKQRAGACCIPYKKSYKCDGLLRYLRVPLYPEGRSPAALHRHRNGERL